MSAKRKLKRSKLKEAEKKMTKALGLFDKIPDRCTACDKPYDKNSKEQVSSWSVAVREKEGKVNLYCPACWDGAKQFLRQLSEEINEKEG